MIEPHHRLQEARRNAGFETASDAARAFGWNENTYRSHENGERGLRPGVAARYAQAFKASASWLLLGFATTDVDIPTGQRKQILILDDDGVRASLDDGTVYFLDGTTLYSNILHRYIIVNTERYYPRYRLGDLILSTMAQADSLMMRDDLLFSTPDGRFYLGDLSKFREENVIKTLNGELIPLDDVRNMEVVMAILKRAFYEVRSENRAHKPE